MNPLLEKIARGLIRLAIVPVAGWLVGHGIIESSETAEFYAEITTYVIAGAWMAWTALKELRVKNTLAASPVQMTVKQAEQTVKAGTFASARTPKDAMPVITDNTKKDG